LFKNIVQEANMLVTNRMPLGIILDLLYRLTMQIMSQHSRARLPHAACKLCRTIEGRDCHMPHAPDDKNDMAGAVGSLMTSARIAEAIALAKPAAPLYVAVYICMRCHATAIFPLFLVGCCWKRSFSSVQEQGQLIAPTTEEQDSTGQR
jgi:hypothetical protein